MGKPITLGGRKSAAGEHPSRSWVIGLNDRSVLNKQIFDKPMPDSRSPFDEPVLSEPFTLRQAQGER
jgi:hypothetical protein